MKQVLAVFAIVLVMPFSGCTESTHKPSAEVGKDSAQPVGTPESSDHSADTPSDDTDDIVFGDKFPEVLAVEVKPNANGKWRFNVTLSSTYDTPQRYADGWRVLDAEGNELGIRVLGHDHANEQPFTRSETIEIPQTASVVFVEGRDQSNGWSGQRFEVKLPVQENAN